MKSLLIQYTLYLIYVSISGNSVSASPVFRGYHDDLYEPARNHGAMGPGGRHETEERYHGRFTSENPRTRRSHPMITRANRNRNINEQLLEEDDLPFPMRNYASRSGRPNRYREDFYGESTDSSDSEDFMSTFSDDEDDDYISAILGRPGRHKQESYPSRRVHDDQLMGPHVGLEDKPVRTKRVKKTPKNPSIVDDEEMGPKNVPHNNTELPRKFSLKKTEQPKRESKEEYDTMSAAESSNHPIDGPESISELDQSTEERTFIGMIGSMLERRCPGLKLSTSGVMSMATTHPLRLLNFCQINPSESSGEN